MFLRRRLVVGARPGDAFLLVVEGLSFVLGQPDRVVLAGVVEFGLVSARTRRAAGLQRADVGLGDGKLGDGGLHFGVVGARPWNVVLVGEGGPFFLAEDVGLGVEGGELVVVLLWPWPGEQFLLVLYF